MLILGVAIPAGAITVLHLAFSARPFIHPLIHTFMESLGVLAAFSLALLLFARQDDQDHAQLVWIACGLLTMGILDGIHSVQPVGVSFVGLNCASTLCGGLLFSFVWLPDRVSRLPAVRALSLGTATAAASLGLLIIAEPDLLPAMFGPTGYSTTAKSVTAIGGLFFLVASIRFVLRYQRTGGFDEFLLASLCLLFGMAALFFPLSHIWFPDWWFWHLLRLVAFLHLVGYTLFVHRRTLAQVKELNETLERRVMDRTAELAAEVAERVQTEEEIKAYNKELLTINRVVTACSGLLDLREALGRVLMETMGIAGLEAGCLCVLNNDGSLNCIAQRRSGEAVIVDQCANDGMARDCFFRVCTGDLQPIILRDHESVLGFSGGRALHGEEVCFHAAFPLVTVKRTCTGVLCLYSRVEVQPADRCLRLVETIVAHLALLIENVRLYEETVSHAATLKGKVAERTRELEEANRKLREVDRIKSLFIASMSHELRTPLNSVIGFTSIILDEWVGPLNDEQKENLAIVLRAGQHLLALINDVIDVSKIEAGQIEVRREGFNLHEVVDEAVVTLREEIHDKGLTLKVENTNRVVLNTDRHRLLQCILNLLSNAAKYTEKGTITVISVDGVPPTATEEARRPFAEITVQDTGIGIPSEDLTRIFGPFARLDSPLRSRVPGTGLGLYLTRKLVTEVLKGEIHCTSQTGRGSRFTIAIPVDGGE